ncbi:hypothetical protein HY634_02580 [Candidatus Uhrbacteria bacterium]|nr:hypothetical protein [Candidatus Uhrbacteria bacterium]
MGNPGVGEFMRRDERSPLEIARERWGIDLNDDRATLNALVGLQGRMPDVADLGNLWLTHQQRDAGEAREAA